MIIAEIPSSQGSLGKAKGAEEAPQKILEHLKQFYMKEKRINPSFQTKKIPVVESNLEETNASIQKEAADMLRSQKCIFLGGDHSITYPLVKAVTQAHPEKNIGFIMFDAHIDAMHDFNPPTHEDFLQSIVNQKIIPKENIVLIGIRNFHETEIEFIRHHKINTFSMAELSLKGMAEMRETLLTIIKHWEAIYVSVDIDVLDPAFAPGTGYAEPGGLTTRELLTLIQTIMRSDKVIAADVVEVCPPKDRDNITSKVAAKVVKELL